MEFDQATSSTPPERATPHDDSTPHPVVVGIGASAGGLKALQKFVEAVPADGGMAYVVIMHLDPERESRMGELLQDRSGIPVTQVSGPVVVEANRIYIIPPGHDLAMSGSTLGLRERGRRSEHAPVDLFFRTLAEAYGPDAVGVVLSGTGSDGTAGIRHIREAGGITVAQSPDEAEYDGMPAAAIATGSIDLVLPSARIPEEILRLRRQPSRLPQDASGAPDLEAGLARVFSTLRTRTGHDFSLYKRSTILRRLDRRLCFNDASTLDDYLAILESSSAECQALLRDLLISVSSFFRDPAAFASLAAETAALFDGKTSEDTVRAWVAGCATGEEAYSVAMVLADHAATLSDPPRIQLFATDIDEKGYGWGRTGLYSAAAVAGMPDERVRRFFTKENGGYRVAKSLRELVLFAGHNVLHDPPFSRMDLISCRNLFIYLQPEAQERALETFRFALNPGGMLFLGVSESVGDSGRFEAIGDTAHRLYRRSTTPYRVPPRLSSADPVRVNMADVGTAVTAASTGQAAPAARPRFSYGALHLRMLDQYAPASVIVNERLDVMHLSSDAGRFLRLGEGAPSHNLLGLAREELGRALRTALHHAFDTGAPATREVSMSVDGGMRQVTVHVRPATVAGDGGGQYALIVFEAGTSTLGAPSDGAGTELAPREVELDAELDRLRADLEATHATHDRTVEELQAVNEELRSINEEQKAATEELETGREEIQSINEELTTINQEHQSTIEELKRTNSDLQNLIESTEIGTVFLDRTARIRRFTPAAAAIFNFVVSDQGRLLSDITHRLDYARLRDDVTSVLASQERLEQEVTSHDGKCWIFRINPYRSFDGDADGVVLTFFDNTAQHMAREELTHAKLSAESANTAKGTFLGTLSHEFRTPLNAILGYADLLDYAGSLNEVQAGQVARIKAGGWHLAAMIDEILSFAKLDSGHAHVDAEPLDARLIAREAVSLVEVAGSAKGLRMELDLPDAALNIETDVDKARQVLINLLGNAVKYTNTGEVRVTCTQSQDRVAFHVTDTGIGIAAEHQPRIFDRFWQVDGAVTRAAGGMGIGLAAAREFARLLGGDVLVESTLDQGSTFTFWLPR
jgi:two-component system, chemotaxis family, CheB/CheR fusion protein